MRLFLPLTLAIIFVLAIINAPSVESRAVADPEADAWADALADADAEAVGKAMAEALADPSIWGTLGKIGLSLLGKVAPSLVGKLLNKNKQ
ncbi:pilosulin-1-like [Pseudomyrmex gracilis]|uniref:pilosulin-1-like n=1 Tax=Pseudomyrmex gracilis TaxID=219809 RepID=UPI0009959897|nr:pilosulin-1-like [Pseudomyrmex gracilis]